MRPEDLITSPETRKVLLKALAATPSPDAREDHDVRSLLERSRRLPDEKEARDAWPPILEQPRLKMDTRYAEPATTHRGWSGLPLVYAKRAFRKAFQPFINEVLRKQVEFNEALLDSLARVYDQQRENVRAQALWRAEISARLDALEKNKS